MQEVGAKDDKSAGSLYSNEEIKSQYIPVYSRMDRTIFPGHF